VVRESITRPSSIKPTEGASAHAAWLEGAAAGWGLPIDPQVILRLDPPEWARRDAEVFFEEHQIADWLPAALAPEPAHDAPHWPAEHFAEIGDRLIASTRAPLLLLTSGGHSAEAVTSRMERRSEVIVVEPRHMFQTAGLIQRSRVLVCSDPGLLHLAATVGTPALGIQSQSERYRPRFPWEIALSDRADVDEVWEALRRLIPLTASPTGVHPTHTAIAGAGSPRAGRAPRSPDESR
jgi:hypothetical protein